MSAATLFAGILVRHDKLDHAEVFLTVIPLTGEDINKRSHRQQIKPVAIPFKAGLLSIQGTVTLADLTGAGHPEVADGAFGGYYMVGNCSGGPGNTSTS